MLLFCFSEWYYLSEKWVNIKVNGIIFNIQKCSSCGRCLTVCSARSNENGTIKIDRKKCIKCGKCAEICLGDANEIIGTEMTASEVLKDKIFYDTSGGGITVTGGEPSYQPEFTLELLSLAKEAGNSVAMETCGIGTRDFYEKAAEPGTTFLYDLKCIDPVRHRNLIVRVGGYSDYFVNLDEALQDNVIERTLTDIF